MSVSFFESQPAELLMEQIDYLSYPDLLSVMGTNYTLRNLVGERFIRRKKNTWTNDTINKLMDKFLWLSNNGATFYYEMSKPNIFGIIEGNRVYIQEDFPVNSVVTHMAREEFFAYAIGLGATLDISISKADKKYMSYTDYFGQFSSVKILKKRRDKFIHIIINLKKVIPEILRQESLNM